MRRLHSKSKITVRDCHIIARLETGWTLESIFESQKLADKLFPEVQSALDEKVSLKEAKALIAKLISDEKQADQSIPNN